MPTSHPAHDTAFRKTPSLLFSDAQLLGGTALSLAKRGMRTKSGVRWRLQRAGRGGTYRFRLLNFQMRSPCPGPGSH